MVVHRLYPETTYSIPIPTPLSHHFREVDEKSAYIIEAETPEGKKVVLTTSPKIAADPASLERAEIERIGRFSAKLEGPSFDDFPGRTVEDVCQQAFDDIKRIVETAERDYWGRCTRTA